MAQRRRFLQVLGVGAGALAPACVVEQIDGGGTGTATSAASGTSTASGASGAGGASAAASSATGASSASGSGGNFTPVAKVADLPMGALKTVSALSILLGRDAGGVYAMTSICTHSGCDMCLKGVQFAGGIRCTCHSSKFDLLGAVVQGPAVKALRHYLVAVDATGEIGVDKTQLVAADFRAPVP